MTLFWIAAAALAGGAALLVMLFARRGAAAVGGENPALAVHRRQLLEIDALEDRGLLSAGDKAAARAEAGRRLLSAAALGGPWETAGSVASRRIALGGVLAAGTCALLLYRLLGAPGVADQPYQARVAAWARGDPAALDAPRMAAVLKTVAARRPADPRVFGFLGRAQMAAGDAFGAQKAFARAAALAPHDPGAFILLGEARLAGASGALSPEDAAGAQAAFRRALALDPRMQDPRTPDALYGLGEVEVLSGDRAGGVSQWRALLAALPTGDPRRVGLAVEIDRVAAGGPIAPPPEAAQAGAGARAGAGDAQASAGTSSFIRAMVAGLAAKLAVHPDDAEGWARLVRAYGVLHDAPAQADALAKARRQFAGRAAALAPIEAEAKAHPAG